MPKTTKKAPAKGKPAANKSASTETTETTTPIVVEESAESVETPATCFKAATAPSKKKRLYWAGFSVVSEVDGKEIDESLDGTKFRRESQAAFAWSESSLAALEGKSFPAHKLAEALGLDFGDY